MYLFIHVDDIVVVAQPESEYRAFVAAPKKELRSWKIFISSLEYSSGWTLEGIQDIERCQGIENPDGNRLSTTQEGGNTAEFRTVPELDWLWRNVSKNLSGCAKGYRQT